MRTTSIATLALTLPASLLVSLCTPTSLSAAVPAVTPAILSANRTLQPGPMSSGVLLVRDNIPRLTRQAFCKGKARARYKRWVNACNWDHPAGSSALQECLTEAADFLSLELAGCSTIR